MGSEMEKELSLKNIIFTDLLEKHSQCNQRPTYISFLCGILSSDSGTGPAGGPTCPVLTLRLRSKHVALSFDLSPCSGRNLFLCPFQVMVAGHPRGLLHCVLWPEVKISSHYFDHIMATEVASCDNHICCSVQYNSVWCSCCLRSCVCVIGFLTHGITG